MTQQRIYRSPYKAPLCPTNISISQYLNLHNPDVVSEGKVILEDDWTGKSLTYGSLRRKASHHAWSLKERFGLGVGDVVAISGPNSVRFLCILEGLVHTDVSPQVDQVQLIHAVLWTGATVA